MRRPNKFNAKRTTIVGITFASKAEAARYITLRISQRAGKISALELQPKFPCVVNGVKVCTYIADFRYRLDGETVVEDVKGMRRGAAYAHFRTKKKLVEALYGVKITEVK